MARLILKIADTGWHVRWHARNRAEFLATRDAFKQRLPLHYRYWDPKAFGGKGGWWVSYGALALVGHLFSNYSFLRDMLERLYWQQQAETRKQGQEHSRREQGTGEDTHKKAEEHRQTSHHEAVTLPRTLAEALALLHLTAPVTTSDVKQAYRAQAMRAHPDHGGSHKAMVRLNAAYELALAMGEGN